MSGIALGCIYGLVALGVVVIFSATRILNFAQGEFLMLGGLTGWWTLTYLQWPYIFGLVATVLVGAIAGVIVNKGVIALMITRQTDVTSMVIATLAVSIVVSQGVAIFTGPGNRAVPSAVSGEALNFAGVSLIRSTLVAVAGSLIALFIFSWIRNHTSTGLALRAVGLNRKGARAIGIKVGRVETIAFALSGSVAAFGGLLIAPITSWTPTMGLNIAIYGFIAAIVGGIANPYSAFIGGLLIGIISSVSQGYLPTTFPYSTSIVFAVLAIVIIIRPSGLIPSLETKTGQLRS
jgi:branched-chain amino acid transport system permease protein